MIYIRIENYDNILVKDFIANFRNNKELMLISQLNTIIITRKVQRGCAHIITELLPR
jgi:hypothetical protein